MRSLFKTAFKVTQQFGVNAAYYGQFGLSGHEGIDLIPTGSDWSVLALEDGIVVADEDNARSGAYGIYVTIWHPSLKKATQYCHLAENYVTFNKEVKRGDVIGKMGSTGNSTGAHVHLNLFSVDDNGVRLNRNNGYLGGTNPLPFLQQDVIVPAPQPSPDLQKELDKIRKERDDHWNNLTKEKELNTKLTELLNQKDRRIKELGLDVSSRDTQVATLQGQVITLTEQANKVPLLVKLLDQAEEDKTGLRKQITKLTTENTNLKKTSYLTAPTNEVIKALLKRLVNK